MRKKPPTGRSTGSGNGSPALVIVESPSKARTINKYLGRKYVVKASKGHVRDLPPHRYGIDPGQNFKPTYEILPSHEKVVAELKKLADRAETVYLATDLDREGEAIAWHLVHALEIPASKIKRVVFNEITKKAVTAAFAHPHEIDTAKVDAQQARRILDRVVGYELSPLLWKKVAKGLSAGRVQSVAVRLIVGREEEIRAFEPQESWTIEGVFCTDAAAARTLSEQWRRFIRPGRKNAKPPTQKDRLAWLSERDGFAASLSELAGRPFKALGTLERDRSKKVKFSSAVKEVRSVAEALGYETSEVVETDWEDYRHLALRKIELIGRMNAASTPELTVKSVDTKRTRSKPSAPFTTATMQQVAANTLRFSTSKTMRTAQALYEGIDIKTGEGNVGLITYMRTDSTNLSQESVRAARDWIGAAFGDRYRPAKPLRYASSKKAQEAHEAIRPTDVTRTPEAMRGHMTTEQHKLYTLIWNRFVACQMVPAEWDATTVLIAAKTPLGEAVFKTTGRVLVFDGFYRVMGTPRNGEEQTLPALKVGQRVHPLEVAPTQKFSAPPPRFTEASLVKTLEAEGIGRPSTYAAIIRTIQDRGYVEQEDRRFHPTSRGEIVTRKLVDHFPKVMDIRFTSHVEDELDKIEESHLDWHHVLHEFYEPFKESLAKAHEEMEQVRAEPSDYVCDACGKPMVYRMGKNGRFLACTGFPDCRVARDVDRDGNLIQPVKGVEACPKCGKDMLLRKSRRGPFLGCSGYPDCTHTQPCDEKGVPLKKVAAADIRESCPECGARMEVKFSRGRSFLGCTAYPKCKETLPLPAGVYVEKPKPEAAGVRCDKCGRPMVIRKSRRGPFLSCSGFPSCRNAVSMDKRDHLEALEAEGKIPEPPVEPVNGAARNGGVARGARAKYLNKEELAALGAPPAGFAWTRTGRPVVETWPEGSLTCFECGGTMALRNGRFGPFFGCTSRGCRAIANLRGEAKKRAEAELPAADRPKPIETDVSCPDCGQKMLLRMGRTGRFLGCGGYPACKKTMEPPPGLLRAVGSASETAAK
ncbi:MAG: type I DNA topoisomerase [Phycisphaerae bacterium]